MRAHGANLDGAVLLGRHLAPHWRGSKAHLEGKRGDELALEARRAGCPHIHDPDTAVLVEVASRDDRRFGRAPLMQSARAVPTRLAPRELADDEVLKAFVAAATSTQVGTTHRSPPYFWFRGLGDPWLEVNQRAARIARELHPDDPLALFVQCPLATLLSGGLAASASGYHTALPERARIYLAVGGLYTNLVEAPALAAYLEAGEAFSDAGFDVIADRVARFGVAAAADRFDGCASGTRVYRHLSARFEWTNEISVKAKIAYELPRRGDRITREVAEARASKGNLRHCRKPGCKALRPGAEKRDYRRHSIHIFEDELEEAGRLGGGVWRSLLAESPRKWVREWAAALELVIARRQARQQNSESESA